MITLPAQEVKRRGIGAVDELIIHEPVHIIKNNRPMYVVLLEEDYQAMTDDLALARIEASEADVREGRLRSGSVADLMEELNKTETP